MLQTIAIIVLSCVAIYTQAQTNRELTLSTKQRIRNNKLYIEMTFQNESREEKYIFMSGWEFYYSESLDFNSKTIISNNLGGNYIKLIPDTVNTKVEIACNPQYYADISRTPSFMIIPPNLARKITVIFSVRNTELVRYDFRNRMIYCAMVYIPKSNIDSVKRVLNNNVYVIDQKKFTVDLSWAQNEAKGRRLHEVCWYMTGDAPLTNEQIKKFYRFIGNTAVTLYKPFVLSN